ncbi:MAG: Class peptide chain release factor [Thermoleophilia bacterium]|nr:Class peptide chain release factor [Thermoleophilia bacterium]
MTIAELGLEPREVALVYERLASRITGAGELTVGAADTRDQHRNRQLAAERMEQLLASALRVARPRVKTKPSRGARLRARASKQQTSQKKGARRWNWGDDD